MGTVEILHSRKSVLLNIDGFLYYKHSGVSRRYWNCRHKGECSARAITIGDGETLVVIKGPDSSPHNHAPNHEAVEAVRVVASVKRAAAEHPDMPPAQIMRKELQKVPSGVLAEVPARPNLRKQISRTRLRQMPPNPTRISDLQEIPDKYQQTLSGHKFLMYDSLFDDDEDEADCGKILIFSTAENLIQLFKCDVWSADGTFKTAPTILYQLFTVLGHGTQVGVNRKPQTVALPYVYALLENKQEQSYKKVFEIISREGRKLGLTTSPLRVMADFELSIIKAVTTVFGPEVVSCCFFHLCNNVYRHVVQEGLQTLYNDSTDRRIKVGTHMLCALAYVPADEVEKYFMLLRADLSEELGPIADYFEATYIRRLTPKRRRRSRPVLHLSRRPARYPPRLWNQYNSVLEETAPTNNAAEGWHNRFQLVVGKHHPSVYAFLEELLKEQADTEIMLRV